MFKGAHLVNGISDIRKANYREQLLNPVLQIEVMRMVGLTYVALNAIKWSTSSGIRHVLYADDEATCLSCYACVAT